jgi:hypothetical protein
MGLILQALTPERPGASVDSTALYQAWGDRILRDYLWGIAGSFAHGHADRQAEIYLHAWCRISNPLGELRSCSDPEIADIMDTGFWIMDRYAHRVGWVVDSRRESWHAHYRSAKRRLRFFVRRGHADHPGMLK